MNLQTIQQEITTTLDLQELDDLRVKYLGKKGKITLQMKELGSLSPDERKERGAELNKIKNQISLSIEEKKAELEVASINKQLENEWVDVSLPTRPERQGKLHPITQVSLEVAKIFENMGFQAAEGPEIEDDWHNFGALNFPENHPARQMHDTFYLNPDADGTKRLLRTHTSSVQIRAMMAGEAPFRIISLGKVYRSDSDPTHTPMFHQIEGLLVDKNIHMGHLKGCLVQFIKEFFEVAEVPVRFRPSFFPFTEPSAEVDIGCKRTKDSLKIGEGDEWLEVLGCGMVHPNVLKNVGIDPSEYQGFAFGMGLDRLAMLKYGIPDLTKFFTSDIRWLSHYGFSQFS